MATTKTELGKSIKGQNLRLFVEGKCVALATSCQLHVAQNLEDSSTKDDTDDWQNQEVTGLSWDGSCDALVCVDTTVNGFDTLLDLCINKTKVAVLVKFTNGTNNRVTNSDVNHNWGGNAYISDVSMTAQNRQNSTYTVQLTGVGALTHDNTQAATS